jgi:hypothetical protein
MNQQETVAGTAIAQAKNTIARVAIWNQFPWAEQEVRR